MTDPRTATIQSHLERSTKTLEAVATECIPSILEAADLISTAFKNGNKLLICGNGGSAADSQHMAAVFTSRLRKDRPRDALPAIALTTDTSFLTAFANDINFEGIFARQVEALGKEGDVLLGITTSGSSKNVVLACEEAAKRGLVTIGLTGSAGLSCDSTHTVAVPGEDTQCTQESHIVIEHLICELVEDHLFPA